MTNYINLEWIGVSTPSQNDYVSWMKLTKQYTKIENDTLEAVAVLLRPRIVSVGTTRRTLRSDATGGTIGLSETYKFGYAKGTFVQRVKENDARLILASPDGLEFRNNDDPAHANRVPVVPPQFMTTVVASILASADGKSAPALGAPMIFDNAQGVLKRYEQIRGERVEPGR